MDYELSVDLQSEDVVRCLDYAEEGICIFNSSRVIVFVNEKFSEMVNMSKDEVVGKKLINLFPELRNSPRILKLVKQNKAIIDQEYTGKRYDGHLVHVVFSSYPIMDPEGKRIGDYDIFRTYQKVVSTSNAIQGNKAHFKFENIIGKSSAMLEVINDAKDYALSDKNVLIIGESGTGKELIAQSIHNYSNRSKGPFVAINCAGLPSELIDSELFGYEGGSFTGAKKTGNIGKFQLADGGTLFLDEIGELPQNLQAKLLRATENKVIRKIGGSNEIVVDVRIIAATNRNLHVMIKEGKFRSDLFYRLNVLSLKIPNLKSRREDIALLVDYFLNKEIEQTGIDMSFTDSALSLLTNLDWEGNVRELENTIYRILVKSKYVLIDIDDVKRSITFPTENIDNTKIKARLPRQIDIQTIEQTLNETGGNKKKAAEILGVSRKTIYRKLEEKKNNEV